MKISLSWIKDYITPNSSVQELADGMTDLGLECTYKSTSLSFSNVVLGFVENCEPHPDSDHLSVCEVNTGDEENWQIVCGAPNVKAGIHVPVAKVGATLSNGDFKIKKAKLRGVKSNGMICSGKELQYSNDHEGILIVDSELPLGSPIESVLNFNQETIFELDLTPNRGDCFSHRGVAREIAVIENSSIEERDFPLTENSESIEDYLSINIHDADACPRYVARMVKNVKVGPSPDWLRLRMESIGQKSINNVVDAANFVLMDTGHPMHTFDFNKISSTSIGVRLANKGEKFTTLDDNEHTLDDFHLLICDDDTPIALAGIMGGKNSEIDNSTTTILIESAYFKPTVIRKGAKKIDLSTDASKRFERDTDMEAIIPALNQLASLIVDVAGGEIVGGIIDEYPQKKELIEIEFSVKNCNTFLGTNLTVENAQSIFNKISISTEEKGDILICTIPSFRNDLEREVDLFEEIARVIGYNNIQSTAHFSGSFDAFTTDDRALDDEIRQFLSSIGFNEHYSNSLNNEQEVKHFTENEPILLSNPLSQEMAYLRNSLFPGILKAISFNEKRQQSYFKLFEIGAVHQISNSSETNAIENFHVAMAWYGKHNIHWKQGDELDIYNVKRDLIMLLNSLGLKKVRFETLQSDFSELGLSIYQRKNLIGEVTIPNKKIKKFYNIKGNCFIASLNIDAIISIVESQKFTFIEPNLYPSINRDIAIQVEKKFTSEKIERIIKSKGGEFLKKVYLFDVYSDSGMKENEHSLAYSLTFQSSKKTLQDTDVDTSIQRICSQLEKDFNAVQR